MPKSPNASKNAPIGSNSMKNMELRELYNLRRTKRQELEDLNTSISNLDQAVYSDIGANWMSMRNDINDELRALNEEIFSRGV